MATREVSNPVAAPLPTRNQYHEMYDVKLRVNFLKTCRLILLLVIPLLLLPPEAFGQQEDPRIEVRTLEHDGTSFRAYVDAKTGTPYWILDVDSLDFNIGQMLASKETAEDAARDFLAEYANTFGISPSRLTAERVTTDGDL